MLSHVVRLGLWATVALLEVALSLPAKDGASEETLKAVREIQKAPHAPVVRVVDTVSSLGPLGGEARVVTLEDLVKYHGHPCDGLVIAAAGITFGLRSLFGSAAVDRTDVVVACNASCCYGDVAAYLTGARARYGSLIIDKGLGDEWILHRRSTGKTFRVRLRPGIKPPGLGEMETRLREAGCDRDLMQRVAQLQEHASKAVLAVEPREAFEVSPVPSFPYAVAPVRADAVKAGCGEAGPKTP